MTKLFSASRVAIAYFCSYYYYYYCCYSSCVCFGRVDAAPTLSTHHHQQHASSSAATRVIGSKHHRSTGSPAKATLTWAKASKPRYHHHHHHHGHYQRHHESTIQVSGKSSQHGHLSTPAALLGHRVVLFSGDDIRCRSPVCLYGRLATCDVDLSGGARTFYPAQCTSPLMPADFAFDRATVSCAKRPYVGMNIAVECVLTYTLIRIPSSYFDASDPWMIGLTVVFICILFMSLCVCMCASSRMHEPPTPPPPIVAYPVYVPCRQPARFYANRSRPHGQAKNPKANAPGGPGEQPGGKAKPDEPKAAAGGHAKPASDVDQPKLQGGHSKSVKAERPTKTPLSSVRRSKETESNPDADTSSKQ